MIEHRQGEANQVERRVRTGAGVTYWSPFERLCTPVRCTAIAAGHLLYRDAEHLNRWGGRYLAPDLKRGIAEAGKAPDPASW